MAAFRLREGIAELRNGFRSEGFRMPDFFAERVSAVVVGKGGAERFHAEADRLGEIYLANTGQPPPLNQMSNDYWMRYNGQLPDTDLLAEEQNSSMEKAAEAERLTDGRPELILRKTDVRKFGESYAISRGFSVEKRRREERLERVLQKPASPHKAWMGEITIDVGGKFGSISSSNQTTFAIVTNEGRQVAGLQLISIVPGMGRYASAGPGLATLKASRFQETRTPQHVSDLIKLGVMAEIAFFDLLLDRLVE